MRAGMNKMWNSARKKEILSTRKPDLGAEIARRKAQAKLPPPAVRAVRPNPSYMKTPRARPQMGSFVMPHLRPNLIRNQNQARSDEEL